jgi:GNAT superfamily N-acetyltransferase
MSERTVRSIRRAIGGDEVLLAHLNRFVQEVHREERPDHFRSSDVQEVVRWYRSRLEEPPTTCWVAEEAGLPIGYLLAMRHRRDATPFALAREWFEIDQLAVDPAYRRRGIGQALMNEALAAAHNEGLTGIEASSWAFNNETHRLLDRMGFAPKIVRFERREVAEGVA